MTQVSELLLLRSSDPRLKLVSVTRAQVSPDLRKARIFYSVLADQAGQSEAAAALRKAAGFIRSNLAATLGLRAVPELLFVYDKNVENAQRVHQVLAELKSESPANPSLDLTEASGADEAQP
jgi:ribosome-binding factor A